MLSALFVFAVGVGALAVVVLFVVDVTQTQHAVRRNYPVIGQLRYLLEHLGVFFRQYFFAMDREEMPFNRAQRTWVYRAAKNLDNTQPFGSTRDLRPTGTILFANTTFPSLEASPGPGSPDGDRAGLCSPLRGSEPVQCFGDELWGHLQRRGAGAFRRCADGRLLDEYRRRWTCAATPRRRCRHHLSDRHGQVRRARRHRPPSRLRRPGPPDHRQTAGFKLVLGEPAWLDDLCGEIHRRGVGSAPNFITVDSADGGTGAAPVSLMDYVGLPVQESLPLVVDKLVEYRLRDRVRGHRLGQADHRARCRLGALCRRRLRQLG